MSVSYGAAVYLGYELENPRIPEDLFNELEENGKLHIINAYQSNESIILGECISATDDSSVKAFATSGNIDEIFDNESKIRALYANVMKVPFENVNKPSLIIATTID